MVKAIIFDLWGTLLETGVTPSPSKQVKYMLRINAPFSDFITVFESSFMTQKHESLQAAFEKVVKDFNIRIPDFVYDKLVGMWNKSAILARPYEDTEGTLTKLKTEGYKIFLLSNIDQFSWEQVKTKFDIDKYFDKVYLSFDTGLIKVDRQAYEKILEENKLKAKDVTMVGDSVDSDIKSAEAAGIKGILIDRRDTRPEYAEPKIKALGELPTALNE